MPVLVFYSYCNKLQRETPITMLNGIENCGDLLVLSSQVADLVDFNISFALRLAFSFLPLICRHKLSIYGCELFFCFLFVFVFCFLFFFGGGRGLFVVVVVFVFAVNGDNYATALQTSFDFDCHRLGFSAAFHFRVVLALFWFFFLCSDSFGDCIHNQFSTPFVPLRRLISLPYSLFFLHRKQMDFFLVPYFQV